MTAITADTALHSDVTSGVRAMAPWLVGVAPFGLVIGVSAAQSDIPTLAGWLTGPAIYAGSAQVATIELLGNGAAPLVVVATALVINLRLALYSASMAVHWRAAPRWWRGLAAYLLVDPSFAVGIERYDREGAHSGSHAHYLAGAAALWITWLAAIAVGATLGAGLPAGLRLEFVVPLFLVGEVVPRLTGTAARRAAVTAAAVAAVSGAMPLHLGLVVAMAAGIAAGMGTREASR